jgi:hypothetical protein
MGYRFNTKGMMIIPNPIKSGSICRQKELIVVQSCYCPNGHNLISPQAVFNGFEGIILKIRREGQEGLVALSPVYGYKSRVALRVEMEEGQIWKVSCPHCDEPLPLYDKCECGADMICLFLDKSANFGSSICICNRIGCHHAGIHYSDEIISKHMSVT